MDIAINEITSALDWESFLLRQQPTALFQSWLWGELQKKLGNRVWRWGLFRNRELVGILQIVKISARRGPFLHIRHGPVLIDHSLKNWQKILDRVLVLAKNEKVWFIRFSPQIPYRADNQRIFRELGMREAPIHAMDAEHCWVLELGKSEEELLAACRKTTRYEIRRAEKLAVEIVKTTSEHDLKSFLTLYRATARRQGFITHLGLEEEFQVFAGKNQALLILAKYHGELLAGAIIIFYGPQAIYHHGASLPSKIPASYLVQWEAIREAKKRGFQVYNLWGIAPDNKPRHPWQGITLFKKGFGGHETVYLHAHDLPIALGYWLAWAIETWRRVRKGY